MHEYGADMDTRTPKDWTPLSYCKAKGKYGATEEKGIYPEVRHQANVKSLLSQVATPGTAYLQISSKPPKLRVESLPNFKLCISKEKRSECQNWFQ